MTDYVKISFQDCPNAWPNSAGSDTVKARWDVHDTNGVIAQIEVSGTKTAINSLNDAVPYTIDGNPIQQTFNAPSGVITVIPTYPTGFDTSKVRGVEFWVEDHLTWSCITPLCGMADRVMTRNWEEIVDQSGDPILFH